MEEKKENKCVYIFTGKSEYFICTARKVNECKFGKNEKCKRSLIEVTEVDDSHASLFGSKKPSSFYDCKMEGAKDELIGKLNGCLDE